MNKYYFTSESVTEGHPDKICDYISDRILDEYLKKDKYAKVAIETLIAKEQIIIAGQVTSTENMQKEEIKQIARDTIKQIGYDSSKDINYKTCKIDINITEQSPDIALGVNKGGAGDQGIMFGYATNETESYMPYAIYTAHKLARRLAEVRKCKIIEYLRPDGKTQVTVEYENNKPKRIENILISAQHQEGVELEKLKQDIKQHVIEHEIPKDMVDKNTKIYINPTGRFIVGGPLGDTGLTGRKIIVDTYGGISKHGGGAFSGKDPSKVDRSGAYMLRHIAKNIVANGFAQKCELQISYAIGKKEPISIWIDTSETNTVPDECIVNMIKEKFDLTPEGIIKYLDLRKPIYTKTTNYGHFGKQNLPWEKIIQIKL